MSDHCEILWVTRPNRYLDLGNGSNKFGNHWFRPSFSNPPAMWPARAFCAVLNSWCQTLLNF